MTDDDRMDRARRIRERREQGSPDATDATDDAADSSDDDTTDTAGSTTDTDVGDAADQSSDGDQTDEEWGETLSEDAGTDDGDSDASGGADGDPDGGGGAEQPEVPTATTASEGGGTAGAAPATEATPDEEDSISAPLPDADQLEDALDDADADSEAETVAPGIEDEDEESQDETRVLEFTLDDEHYCLDIEYIEEIVKQGAITRVPNTPAFVEGVVDLRGQITTILNPKVTIDKENEGAGDLIIVFDAESFDDQGYIGWVVDDVRQVSPITSDEVNDPPVDENYIRGVIDRDDGEDFVIWTTPDLGFQDEA